MEPFFEREADAKIYQGNKMPRGNYSMIRKGYEPEEPITPFSWK